MNASVTMRHAGQSKKMAEARLSFEQRKTILKWRLKFENILEAQRQWRREYATEPPTRLTIARILDKFEMLGTECDVHKGRSGGLAQQQVLLLLLNSLHARHGSLPNNVHVGQELVEQAYEVFLKQQDGKFSSQDYYMHWMKTTLIEGCCIVSGSKTWYERMRSLWGKWFGLMKHSLIKTEQWTDVIVCIGPQKIHTFM